MRKVSMFWVGIVLACVMAVSALGAPPDKCDQDGDGYLKAKCTNTDIDCDDSNPDVNPGAEEVCDSVDNDCDGAVDEDLPGCGSGGIHWGCTTDFNYGMSDGSLTGQCLGLDYGCQGGVAETWLSGDPYDRTDSTCLATLYLGAGGGEPRVELSCMVTDQYAANFIPYVPEGQDGSCDTRDDPFMIRMGGQFEVDNPALPTAIVASVQWRLGSKSPDRLFELFDPTQYLPGGTSIQIRDDVTLEPVPFTIPIRCNDPFFCFQGKGCKDPTAAWGSVSHSEIYCTPVQP
ncbi:MAG: putative metal-binding motif-containing protein [Acidobacteriota bacterium]|nr:MAG: putative metal-binding motif-containing protein [Acidobacteriota bacterium]